MSETPESRRAETNTVTTTAGTAERRYADDRYGRPNRLNQALAWVGIVAGVVFIVAVIFFTGFWLGRTSGHQYQGWHRCNHTNGQMAPGMVGPGMMGPGGMMGPSQMGPGQMQPGQMAPGGSMAPQPTPTTTAPGTPRP
jgi:hypothetical protein